MVSPPFTGETNMYDRQSSELSEQVLRQRAPAVFAEAPAGDRSSRYGFVNTHAIIGALGFDGWFPVGAQQQRVRSQDRVGVAKHLVRFRHEALLPAATKVGDYVPELLLANSHDGTSSYNLTAGLFRFVCLNGLVVSDGTFAKVRVAHVGDIAQRVLEGSYTVVENVPAIAARVEEFKARELSNDETLEFSRRALELRGVGREDANAIGGVLRTYRREDQGNSLWAVFNRVQENLVNGHYRTLKPIPGVERYRTQVKARAIKGIDTNLKVNKGLWELAEEFAAAA